MGNKLTFFLVILASMATTAALTIAGVALIVRFNDTNLKRDRQVDINKAVCHAASSDRIALRALVTQADKALGTPKSAGYVYYKSHPDELAAAHAQNQYDLKAFLPEILCDKNGKAYKPGG